jgi:hypothetical protein
MYNEENEWEIQTNQLYVYTYINYSCINILAKDYYNRFRNEQNKDLPRVMELSSFISVVVVSIVAAAEWKGLLTLLASCVSLAADL